MSSESRRLTPVYSELDDADLLGRHVAGDHEAFGELFRRHQDRLWAVAVRTLGNPDDAADALQNAMINAFRRAGQFSGRSAVTTWLHRIVVNACLDQVRRAASRPADPVPFEESPAESGSSTAGQTVGLVDAGAPDLGDQTALRLDLDAALATLPDEQRIPLVLIDVEGYGVADVATLLDIPAGTVKSRCARARAKLAPLLADAPEDPRSSEPGNPTTGPGNRPAAGSQAASGNRTAGHGVSSRADEQGGGDHR